MNRDVVLLLHLGLSIENTASQYMYTLFFATMRYTISSDERAKGKPTNVLLATTKHHPPIPIATTAKKDFIRLSHTRMARARLPSTVRM